MASTSEGDTVKPEATEKEESASQQETQSSEDSRNEEKEKTKVDVSEITKCDGIKKNIEEKEKPSIRNSKAEYNWSQMKKEFYQQRKIVIRNIPPSTYEEVKQFMGGYSVANISISRKARTAYVTLKNGEDAEQAAMSLNCKKLLEVEVEVQVNPNETLLCVAHLPLDMNDQEFRQLVMPYGNIEKCFLMRSEEAGTSKGYGFVQYTHNRDHTNTARLQIDGKYVQGNVIHCDFVLPELASLDQLQSKCLFVEHLPINYSDNDAFRNLCNKHGDPLYCKIAMKDGRPLGFAIVEFDDAATAEKCQQDLNGFMINDSVIRSTFCIPGESAMEICNRLISALNTNVPEILKAGLLPKSPMPQSSQAQALKSLFQQLQVIQFNVQNLLKSGGGQTQMPAGGPVPGLLGPPPNSAGSNPMMQQAIALLVSSMQNNPQQQQLMFGLQNLQNILQQQAAHETKNNLGNQQQSILGNPVMFQTNAFLQSIIQQFQQQQQGAPTMSPTSPPNRNQPVNKPNNPLQALLMNMPSEATQTPPPPPQPQNPSGNALFSIINALTGTQNPNSLPSGPGPGNRGVGNQIPHPAYAPYMNNNAPVQMINSPPLPRQNHPSPSVNNRQQQQQVQAFLQSLLGNVLSTITNLSQNQSATSPPLNTNNQLSPPGSMPPPLPPGPRPASQPTFSRSRSVSRSSSQSRDSSHSWDRLQDRRPSQITSNDNSNINHMRQSRYRWSQSSSQDSWEAAHEYYESWDRVHLHNVSPDRSQLSDQGYESSRWMSPPPPPPPQHHGVPHGMAIHNEYQPQQDSYDSSLINYYNAYDDYMSQNYHYYATYTQADPQTQRPSTSNPPTGPQLDAASIQNLLAHAFSAGAQQSAIQGPGTPNQQGVKRDSSHFLPKAEPSPNGDYIGQHSQGIGGHYADSYKRKRIL